MIIINKQRERNVAVCERREWWEMEKKQRGILEGWIGSHSTLIDCDTYQFFPNNNIPYPLLTLYQSTKKIPFYSTFFSLLKETLI